MDAKTENGELSVTIDFTVPFYDLDAIQMVWHGNYVNGQRNGYFTLQMRDGSVATVEFVNGKSKYDYFVVTSPTGEMQKRPVSEIRSLLNI
jgi:acyl-CoA thioesterase FadM